MRRLLLFSIFAALALPTGALALRAAPGDGTLSVRNADGLVAVDLARGAVVGRIARGKVTVVDPRGGDCDTVLVWDGGERADYTERSMLGELGQRRLACVFRGKSMRFRVGGGVGALVVDGRDVSLAAVGLGFVVLKGRPGSADDGTYSLNGERHVSMPDESLQLTLATATAPPG